MAKSVKFVYFCNECGYESAKWMGQCPACKSWNTFTEEKVEKAASSIGANAARGMREDNLPISINEIDMTDQPRYLIGIEELDRVLGGGLVRGSLTLVGGDPGIGKSTLLLQVCKHLSDNGKNVLYVSGEESLRQIKLRAQRIGQMTDGLKLLCETDLGHIEDTIKRTKPEVVVIDSIQTMVCEEVSSSAGSVSQVREATNVLMRIAKEMAVTVFIVGHVTKEGTVAGPRVLEHMVDTVLYFEGDRHASYRILRGVKNRFGSTNEIGVFEMKNDGLSEVKNPSEYMLSGKPVNSSGSIVSCSMEGTRPVLIEIQALVTRTSFGFPRRQAEGSDSGRLNLLMAVMEKRLNLSLSDQDAYVNIAGGIRINEPAIDLGIVMAIVSSFKNRPIDDKMTAFGEVGLSGEVRAVSQTAARIKEAAKLGFTACIVPYGSLNEEDIPKGIRVIGVKTIAEAVDLI